MKFKGEADRAKIGVHRDLEVVVDRDGTVEAPAWAADVMAKQGFTPVPGEKTFEGVRKELEQAPSHELMVFINAHGFDAHYYEAHEHPMSAEAIAKGLPHIADELDVLYQHMRKVAAHGRGQIKLVTTDPESRYDLREFAYRVHDAIEKNMPLPECPWSPEARARARLARKS